MDNFAIEFLISVLCSISEKLQASRRAVLYFTDRSGQTEHADVATRRCQLVEVRQRGNSGRRNGYEGGQKWWRSL